MIDIIWSGIAGGLLAGVAAGITALIIGTRLDRRPKIKVAVLAFVVVVSASSARLIPNQLISREEKALKKFSEQMLQNPEIKEKLQGASSAEEARNYGMMLSSRGIQRLNDSQLITLLELRTKLTNNAEEEACAIMARGKAAEMPTLILQPLSDEDIDTFLNLTLEAMRAELDATVPRRTVSEQEITAANESFYKQLSGDETEKFNQLSDSIETSSDTDACWAQKLLYERVNRLSEKERIIWSLMLTNTGE